MPVSGSADFELDVTSYIEEAYERCGLEVRTGYDLKTAKRSLNLVLAEWANRGLNQWTIRETQIPLTQGTGDYDLGIDTIDVLNAVLRRDNTDYQLSRISRSDYRNIPDKSTQSRPNDFFIDRQINPTLRIWPLPENSTDVIIVDRMVRMDDADSYTNTMEVPFRLYPCLAAGLAYHLAVKKAPDRIQILKALYEEEMDRALSEDRDRASFNVVPWTS